MFCYNCGIQLPDEASFCWKCGKPQKQESETTEPKQGEESKLEICEIVSKKVRQGGVFSGDSFIFWARAIGPKGQYDAGQSETFTGYYGGSYSYPDSERNDNQDALKGLIDELVKDGWAPTGDRGSDWWSYRFRRRILDRVPEDQTVNRLDQIVEQTRNLIKTKGMNEAVRFYHDQTGVPMNLAKDVVGNIKKGAIK